MSLQAHAFVTLNPTFIEPEFLVQYSQASGFIDLNAEGQLRDDGDSTKPINWLRAHDYVRKSLEMFP